MPKAILLLVVWPLLFFSCAQYSVVKQPVSADPNDLTLFAMQGKAIKYINTANPTGFTHAQYGRFTGQASPRPTLLSAKWRQNLSTASELYESAQYEEASLALKPALEDESDNPFILEQYAKALYKTDTLKDLSRKAYERLLDNLDSAGDADNSTTVVNLWFREAYWKTGTLCLESKEWEKAAYNISRAIAAFDGQMPQGFFEQALQFLTEAFYQQDKLDEAGYYACKTLKLYPRNDYVLQYLHLMKKKCAE